MTVLETGTKRYRGAPRKIGQPLASFACLAPLFSPGELRTGAERVNALNPLKKQTRAPKGNVRYPQEKHSYPTI